MKPRLRKTASGLWECVLHSRIADKWIIGLGFTPKDAYDNWLIQSLEEI